MIRVTFDANVLVSAFVSSSGTLALLVDRMRAGEFRLVVSDHIVDEISRTWTKPYWRTRFPQAQVDRALALLKQKADMTLITVEVTGVATHPEDDLVIATAISGNVDFLVTGDGPCRRRVERYEGALLLSPREFLDLLEREGQLRER